MYTGYKYCRVKIQIELALKAKLSLNVDIEINLIKSTERIGFAFFIVIIIIIIIIIIICCRCFLFISNRLDSYAIYGRNVLVLEMTNFTPAFIKGWIYVRTILSEPKFLQLFSWMYSPFSQRPYYILFTPTNFAQQLFPVSPGYYSRPEGNRRNLLG